MGPQLFRRSLLVLSWLAVTGLMCGFTIWAATDGWPNALFVGTCTLLLFLVPLMTRGARSR